MAEQKRTSKIDDASDDTDRRGQALVVVRGPFLGKKVDVPESGMIIGRSEECDLIVGTATDGTSRTHARLSFKNGSLCIEDLGSTNGLLVNRKACRQAILKPGDLLQVGATLLKVIGDMEEIRFHEMMYNMVVRDSLTGLYNRTHLESVLGQEISRARRYGHPLSLLLIDLDRFKEINDTFGHVAGDAVLCRFGKLLTSFLRAHDMPCRYGGDEFLILLPKTDVAGAMILAERCRQTIMTTRFSHGVTRIPVTVSVGVASLGEGSDRPETLILAADEALYLSKKNGRNQISESAGGLGETQPLPSFHSAN